ncbi:IS3 family transposase [Corynebacterium spheniscorum]|uniref:IS3 family transposase n=1 Tax=Corynebacterium spheniscorum TaxID=185761 RepID=UPI0015A50CEA
MEVIKTVHQANYGVYGIHKMWHALQRDGIAIGYEHTARLMRLAGVKGKSKGTPRSLPVKLITSIRVLTW